MLIPAIIKSNISARDYVYIACILFAVCPKCQLSRTQVWKAAAVINEFKLHTSPKRRTRRTFRTGNPCTVWGRAWVLFLRSWMSSSSEKLHCLKGIEFADPFFYLWGDYPKISFVFRQEPDCIAVDLYLALVTAYPRERNSVLIKLSHTASSESQYFDFLWCKRLERKHLLPGRFWALFCQAR